MNIWQIALYLVACILVADLITPLCLYILYKSEKILQIILWRIPATKVFAEYFKNQAGEDIKSVKPPKTIKYVRNIFNLIKRDCVVKPSYMITKFKQGGKNILVKYILKFIQSPFLKLSRDKIPDSLHNSDIIAGGKK
jgi:hypothetical protein